MSDTAKMWRQRVAAWRASGETAEAYSARHGWVTSTLQYWSSRLGREDRAAGTGMRFARLVRRPQAASDAAEVRRGTVMIEFLEVRARVTVEGNADRETLATVLAWLERLERR